MRPFRLNAAQSITGVINNGQLWQDAAPTINLFAEFKQ